jgi:hypothetical protein
MFCALGLIFGGNGGIEYHFYVLRSRTHFRLYKGRRVPLSYFALPGSLSAGPRASGPVFIFCAPAPIFGGTEGVGSRFHVLRSQTHFRRYRGRRDPFSCFAFPDPFSTVTTTSGPVFMFSAQRLIFGGIDGVGICFHVFMFRVPGPVFGCTDGVESSFHVLRSRTYFRRY